MVTVIEYNKIKMYLRFIVKFLYRFYLGLTLYISASVPYMSGADSFSKPQISFGEEL